VSDSRGVGGVSGPEVEDEAESFEVFPDVFEVWIALVQLPARRKLLLEKNFYRRIHDSGRKDHGAFRVKVAAIALEMRREEHD
jgi:hypothetical protein